MTVLFKKSSTKRLRSESGVSLVETLVAISLLSIAMVGITSMLIMSMSVQDKVNADFRSQQDVRLVLYDMEKNIAEAKRNDTSNNQPVFHTDLISFPSQNGNKWITYTYETPPGSGSPTFVRVITTGKPALPLTLQESDKKMINVNPEQQLVTSVERVSPTAPIFSYYGENGTQIAAPVMTPRDVRSVKITFRVFVSDGHAQRESTVESTQINLRNF